MEKSVYSVSFFVGLLPFIILSILDILYHAVTLASDSKFV